MKICLPLFLTDMHQWRPNFSGQITSHMLLKNRKAIMLRSRLKNKANSSKNPEDMTRYKKQRNLVVNMNRHAKKFFFSQKILTPRNVFGRLSNLVLMQKESILMVKELFLSKMVRLLSSPFTIESYWKPWNSWHS